MSRLFRINVPYICRIPSRTAAFKAIKADLDVLDPSTEKARIVSKNVRTILNNLFELARAGGGSKAVHRHTIINKKLLVRQRLKLLFDPASPILEIGILGGMHMDYGNLPAAGSVAAIGKIQQQYCIVAANDGTVKGGTLFPITVTKQLRMQELSYLNRIPCIYLVDSGGAYLPLQADIFPDKNHGGRTFYNEAVLSSLGIPQIALVCGSCTAGGAYCPTMAEEAIIVNNLGSIFLAGPPLVKAATGEEVSEQDLGGADVHCCVSGCTDYFAETEEEAFELCKESVLALNLPPTPVALPYKEPCYNSEDLAVLAGQTFLSKEDMYLLLSRILDESKFKEFKENFGENLILGFGFIYGQMVGIVANCNSLTPADADKGSHFIQLCQKRGISLIFLQNSGSRATSDLPLEALRVRAKMTAAVSCAKVPKISINVGGCYLDDNYSMCSFDFKPNFFFSWPLAYVSHSRSFNKEERERDVRSKISQAEVSSDYEFLFQDSWSSFYTASRMFSDGIIHPEETRQVLGMCLEITRTKALSSQKGDNLQALFRM